MSREYLTAAEVAAITGLDPRSVAEWARAHHIRPTTVGGQVLYPAALTRHQHARDVRIARAAAEALRLRRWVARALIA
ncbi:helix-turn-helix domain-containing protein [Micromonospora sp. ATA32]|nr:helix-turn-helix domain-containing protein [Micromonospora sp. ATA32]